MKINLITVCTDAYPMIYADKIIRRFKSLTNFEVDAYCITDRPDEIRHCATPIEPEVKTVGWWNKVLTYSPNLPEGWNLYLDIDIVLIENFDKELEWVMKQDRKIACVSDAIGWMGNKYSSSMMVFKTGSMADIYEIWLKNYKQLESFEGGDQVWAGPYIRNRALYIDEKFPKIKLNLKYHLGQKIMEQWQFRQFLPARVKMVDCGGRPKPHEITNLDYIVKNWHEV